MADIRKVAVFCGSSVGNAPIYAATAKELGKMLSQKNIDLIYGGGSVGLMGLIADEMLANKQEVIGIIPKKIYDWEVGHEGITRLEVVDDMHKRKARMAELSDAFIAIPGGIGTLEEIIEAFTWLQLDYHDKPCALLNINGYYDHLIKFLDHMVSEGFLKSDQRNRLIIAKSAEEIIEKIVT